MPCRAVPGDPLYAGRLQAAAGSRPAGADRARITPAAEGWSPRNDTAGALGPPPPVTVARHALGHAVMAPLRQGRLQVLVQSPSLRSVMVL